MIRNAGRPAGRTAIPWALLAACLAAAPALAERTDRDKPIHLEADRMTVDDAKQVAVFEGSVRLTQGTMTIRADKIVVRQDQDGFQHGTAYGNPATFRQKREGTDEFIEGYGERMEYDGRADQLELFTGARIVRGQDEVRGSYISYNAVTEFFKVVGSSPQKPEGRVRAVIQPKSKEEPAPKPPVSLKPSGTLGQ